MIYLIVKILVLLLLAAACGGLIGWLLRGLRDTAGAERRQAHDATRLRDLRAERDAAEAKLASAKADAEAAAADRIAEAEARVAELEQANADLKDAASAADAAAVDRLEAAEAALADCRSQVIALESAVAPTPTPEPAPKPESEAPLAVAALETPSAPAVTPEPPADPNAPAESNAQVAPVGADAPAETAPAAMAEPEDGGDDLQRIAGVGPKIEGLLHEMGVWRFSQIAAFTPAEVAWVDERLKFKGRIEREDWIGQAKAFAAEREKI